ncbi:uncharacterized protein LACBIDRAFT_325581 [Laccaria bicolor S238N-H82]|uniref:Predicted protein n=1 Tax=Laccaria bicolor (strain S238N-H82 / ATCC MYA-4686) TaxID=486041 RepID=B0D5J0_LACBS|nr:uncharacterized protein LACBIDRAFT_325581 [Laccaria bicolor S238N-H82]EDR09777.1 predicted protein [Laccaria bicolor S238N-H82]|eukprot:XP_001879162.1 predicted protein [Laccaria bicolor S238N-H82]
MRSETKNLHSKVAEIARTKDPKICGGLFFVANWMRDASGRLSLTSFYYWDLVWHVASFQCLYMETLAMVDWFKTWEARLLEPNCQVYPVDETMMGAITDSLETAETLFRIGVPVWLACQAHFEGFLGPEDPKPVVTEPQSGLLSVEPGAGPSRTDRDVVRASPYSNTASSSTKASGSMSGVTTCVNHEKFREIEEVFIPPQSPVWKKALQNVNPNPSRIKSSKDRAHGYQFPDPWLFMKGTNHKAFTLAWLISHSQWLQSFTPLDYSPSPAPHSQHWRDFLYQFSKEMNLVDALQAKELPTSQPSHKGKTPANSGRKSDKSKQRYTIKRGELLKNAQTTFFGPRVKVGERPHSIFWRDVSVMEGNTDHLTPAISAEILWNLFEQNFRLELRMVDQQVLPADWASWESAAVRDELVRRIFPEDDDGYIVGRLPDTNVGLVAENWRDRARSVEALRVLITGWPGPDVHALASMPMFDGSGKLAMTRVDFERMEEKAVGLKVWGSDKSALSMINILLPSPLLSKSLPPENANLFPVNTAPKSLKAHKAAKGNLYTPAGHFVQPFKPGVSKKAADPFQPLATTITFENEGGTVQLPGKKQKQFQRWETEVLPSLMEPYVKLLHEVDSLRDMVQVRSRKRCAGCIEILSLCNCTSPALQLLELGPIQVVVDTLMNECIASIFMFMQLNLFTLKAFLCLDSLQRRLVWIVLHVPKTLQQTVYETVNSSWRPSCASISLNVDSFGYYFMSRKRSDKPFTKPSTLRGDSFGYYFMSRKRSDKPFTKPSTLHGDSFGYYFMSRKRSDKPFTKPSTLRGGTSVCIFVFLHLCPTLPKTFLWLDFLQRRFVSILLHVPKMIQQTVHESVIPSWRLIWTLLHILKMLQQTGYESVDPLWSVWKSGLVTGKRP